jgi:hypothetical protein
MEMTSEAIAPVNGRSRKHRSAVTAGNRLFEPSSTDGRTCASRRFSDILWQIQADLGGAEHLSEGQRQLCRRAATMCVQLESMEGEAVAGRAFDLYAFGSLSSHLRRIFETIGLERRRRDITPDLKTYLQAKG